MPGQPNKSKSNASSILNIRGGVKIKRGDFVVGNKNVSVRHQKSLSIQLRSVYDAIDASEIPAQQKGKALQTVNDIESELQKGETANPNLLESSFKKLARIAPDIFEVAVATIANPTAGFALVAQKVAQKAKGESA